jgi:hypothetical protein
MILVDAKSFGIDVYMDLKERLWIFDQKLLKNSFEEIGEAMLTGKPVDISILWDNHWEEQLQANVSVQSKKLVFQQIGPTTTIVDPHRKPLNEDGFEPGEAVLLTRAALGHDPEKNQTFRFEKHRVGEVVQCDPGRETAIVRLPHPYANGNVDVQIGRAVLDKMINPSSHHAI